MNKYERVPEYVLDLHGYTLKEAEQALISIVDKAAYTHIRVITGKGTFRERGPVLKNFVRDFFLTRGIHYMPSKPKDGGEGAYEVFFTKI
jgi:DNA-nicking Smr family endonuclease